MKLRNLLVLLSVAAALALCGCGVVSEAGSDVSNKFDQGITGQGRIISPNQVSDSFGSEYN